MGNRAVVIFKDVPTKRISPCIYLHWNGGPESVYAFLDEMDRRDVRGCDPDYEAARFVHIVGEFFDQDSYGGLWLRIWNGPPAITPEALLEHDHGDNGIYVVCRLQRDGKRRTSVERFYTKHDPVTYKPTGIEQRTAAEVESERERAYKSEYRIGKNPIQDVWKKLRPDLEINQS